MDRELFFDRHMKHAAHQAFLKVFVLRREVTRLQRLDMVERRVQRLIKENNSQTPQDLTPLHSLERCRDVAALVVFHKVEAHGVPRLARLRPPREAVSYKMVLSSHEQVAATVTRQPALKDRL